MINFITIAGSIASLVTSIAAIIGLLIARKQLNSISEQLKVGVQNQRNDSLKIVLEIETQMNSRKLEFDKASKIVRESTLLKKSDEEMDIISDYFNAVKESYFNSMDRLCYCIDKEYINDKDWTSEYRNMLYRTIEEFPDDFNEASPYRNMKKINKKWQESN
jgi:DNA integrity scanning protein DisA with diadenylate cyclase activity